MFVILGLRTSNICLKQEKTSFKPPFRKASGSVADLLLILLEYQPRLSVRNVADISCLLMLSEGPAKPNRYLLLQQQASLNLELLKILFLKYQLRTLLLRKERKI